MEQFAIIDQLSTGGPKYTWNLIAVEEALQLLIFNSVLTPKIRNSFNRGTDLLKAVNQAIVEAEAKAENDRKGESYNPFLLNPIIETDMTFIRNEWQKMKPILTSEIGILPTYFIDSIAAYDTDALIESGEKLFPTRLLTVMPEVALDAEMAAKSLVFRMPTACGFHIFRIIESVARIYFAKLEPEIKKPKTLGWISKELDMKSLGDEKVAFALENLVSQFRNPIFHPDISLTQEEAILLVGLANSVLTPMLSAIESQPTA